MSDVATLTLTEFLLARIPEDEAAARAAIKQSGASWGVDANEDDGVAVVTTAEEFRDAYRGNRGLLWDWEDGYIGAAPESATHIARHDPARVLAECEAKRRIVKWATDWPLRPSQPSDEDAILRPLAAIYADHPDYREEWRP